MIARTARRSRYALVAVAVAATAAIAVIAFTRLGHPAGPVFSPPPPAAAPASWARMTLPNGTAVLSYPPSLHPIAGDKVAVSAAQLDPGGAFQLYLNATPRQGAEHLQNWAAFRLKLLRSDTAASAHQVAAVQGVTFRGGTGSCVIDTYITRTGAHHFQEIACLVQGHTSASVIVAAAPAARWAQARPLLYRAVAAYLVH